MMHPIRRLSRSVDGVVPSMDKHTYSSGHLNSLMEIIFMRSSMDG